MTKCGARWDGNWPGHMDCDECGNSWDLGTARDGYLPEECVEHEKPKIYAATGDVDYLKEHVGNRRFMAFETFKACPQKENFMEPSVGWRNGRIAKPDHQCLRIFEENYVSMLTKDADQTLEVLHKQVQLRGFATAWYYVRNWNDARVDAQAFTIQNLYGEIAHLELEIKRLKGEKRWFRLFAKR